MIHRLFVGALAAAVATLALVGAPAFAQDNWPSKPVKLIVPFPAGGTIGTARAAKMPADGYTLVLTGVGSNAVAHGLDPKLAYDSNKDFVHINQIHSGPNVLVVHPSTPFKTFKERVAYVRANPARLNYGFTHAASGHMAMELLKLEASKCGKGVKDCNGIFMVGIPYRGGGPMMQDLLGGITPFLKIMALADQAQLRMAPHFAMEIHLHLSAAYPHEPWVEHFEWLEPMFNERLTIENGRMQVPNRPGLGFSLSEQAMAWTAESAEFGQRP